MLGSAYVARLYDDWRGSTALEVQPMRPLAAKPRALGIACKLIDRMQSSIAKMLIMANFHCLYSMPTVVRTCSYPRYSVVNDGTLG